LAEGRIALLSILAAANGFIGCLPPSNTWPLDPREWTPKWHLDRFTGFCAAYPCVQHRDTWTMLGVTSVAIGRIYVVHVTWPGNERNTSTNDIRKILCSFICAVLKFLSRSCSIQTSLSVISFLTVS